MLVNGEQLDLSSFPDVHSLKALVLHFKLNPEAVAIEINGSIPPRKEWDQILLKAGDKIELIRFVGGG